MFETDPVARAINEAAYQWKIQNFLKMAELQSDPAIRERILNTVMTLLQC